MKNVVIVGSPEFVSTIKQIVASNFANCGCETYSTASEALNRVCYNQFNVLISEVILDDPQITGATLAKLAYPLGKQSILVSKNPLFDRLWMKCFCSKLHGSICIHYGENSKLLTHLHEFLELDHIDPIQFFETMLAR